MYYFHLQASFFGGIDELPSILARQTIFGILVDPGAAILVVIVTALLCTGIKEVLPFLTRIITISFIYCLTCLQLHCHCTPAIGKYHIQSSLAQAIITSINISALVFIILAGAYLGCKIGWPGYEVSSG